MGSEGCNQDLHLNSQSGNIYISANEKPGVILSIGALPFSHEDHKSVIQTVTVPDQLMLAVPLFVRSEAGKRRANWEKVITEYGNTFGAHLSTTVPEILDDVHYFGLSETDFGTYMLRSLGVMISNVCHELIHHLDHSHIAATHKLYMAGVYIFTAEFMTEKDETKIGLMLEPFDKERKIMSYRNTEGETITSSINEKQQWKFTITK